MGVALSNRECVDLLKDWGFKEIRGNGGHVVLELNGREVQLTAVGRSTSTPYAALKKAARIVEVPLNVLMKGPDKPQSIPEIRESISGAFTPPVRKTTAARPRKTTARKTARKTTVSRPKVAREVSTTVVPADLTCPLCSRPNETRRAYLAHFRSHETLQCPRCSNTVVRTGLGPHMKFCTGDSTKPIGLRSKNRTSILIPAAEDGQKDLKKYATMEDPINQPTSLIEKEEALVAKYVDAAEKAADVEYYSERNDRTETTSGLFLKGKDDLRSVLELMFPDGISLDSSTLTALAQWIDCTELLLKKEHNDG